MRLAFGLAPVTSISQFANPNFVTKLINTYGQLSSIDAWLGIICQKRINGAAMGDLGGNIILDMFIRLRNGDRLWFENYMPP